MAAKTLKALLVALGTATEAKNWDDARTIATECKERFPKAKLPATPEGDVRTWDDVLKGLDALAAQAAESQTPAAPESAPKRTVTRKPRTATAKKAETAPAAPVVQETATATRVLRIVHTADGTRLLDTDDTIGRLVSAAIGAKSAMGELGLKWGFNFRDAYWYVPQSQGGVKADAEWIEMAKAALESAGHGWSVSLEIEEFDKVSDKPRPTPKAPKAPKVKAERAPRAPRQTAARVATGQEALAALLIQALGTDTLLAALGLSGVKVPAAAAAARPERAPRKAKIAKTEADVQVDLVAFSVEEGSNPNARATDVRVLLNRTLVKEYAKAGLSISVYRKHRTLIVKVTTTKPVSMTELRDRTVEILAAVEGVEVIEESALVAA